MTYWQEFDCIFRRRLEIHAKTNNHLDVLFRTVSRGSRVPWGGSRVPQGQFSEGSEKVKEKVREGWRRLEEVGGGSRRFEKVGESWIKLEKRLEKYLVEVAVQSNYCQ